MKTTAIATAILLAGVAACGPRSASPATTPATAPATTAPPAAAGHITIVPFKVTTIRTGPDGATSVNMVVTGDAGGVIAVSRKGEARPLARIDESGELHAVEGGKPPPGKIVVEKDGRLTIDGADMAKDGGVKVTADGSVFLKGEHALRLEGGRVVDVTGKLLRSTITVNGNSRVSTFAITYEGGDDARQLVGIMLALQLAPTKHESEPAGARQAVP